MIFEYGKINKRINLKILLNKEILEKGQKFIY